MPTLRIKGIVHYRKNLKFNISNSSGSEFFFEHGYISESGFSSQPDSFYSFYIGANRRSGEVLVHTNLRPKPHFSSMQDFRIALRESSLSQLKIGIWFDENSDTCVLAREAFGTVPLFYIHIPDVLFAFATSMTDLLDKPELKDFVAVNARKVASHVAYNHLDSGTDASSTFFSNIKSCLPGHMVTASRQDLTLSTYTAFDPSKWSGMKTAAEYGDAVLGSFRKSMLRVSGTEPMVVGSHLSGGLDSSSISSLFRHLYPTRPLHTFHIGANHTASDESGYAAQVAGHIGSIHHVVEQSTEEIRMLRLSTELYGQPETSFLSPASNLHTIGQARDFGCDILLNGHGGDSIIGNGLDLLEQSFKEKNWALTGELLRKRVSYAGLALLYPKWNKLSFRQKYHLILQNFLYTRLAAFRSLPASELFQLFREVSSELNISYFYFAKRASKSFLLRMFGENFHRQSSLAREEYTAESGHATEPNFPKSLLGDLPAEYQDLFEEVFHPQVMRGQEQFFALSDHFGLSNRSPYLDKEMFELCLAVPHSIKFGDGIGRAHLRDAMKGILLEEIRCRGTKSSLSSPDGENMTIRLLDQGRILFRMDWMYGSM